MPMALLLGKSTPLITKMPLFFCYSEEKYPKSKKNWNDFFFSFFLFIFFEFVNIDRRWLFMGAKDAAWHADFKYVQKTFLTAVDPEKNEKKHQKMLKNGNYNC